MAYLALAWPDNSPPPSRQIRAALKRAGLSEALSAPTLMLFIDAADHFRSNPSGDGGLLGAIFPREGATGPDFPDWRAMEASRGRWLIDHVWGRYIAFGHTADQGVDILRDPSGALPAYMLRTGPMLVVTSDLALARFAGLLNAQIDWEFVGEDLVFQGRRGARTGLRGVEELVPGRRVTLGNAGLSQHTLWDPWSFAAPDRQIRSISDIKATLREQVIDCAHQLTAKFPTVTLELSGGLDSSIVAASLAGRSGIQAVNCVTNGAEGDERDYARAVSETCGIDLVTSILDAQASDVTITAQPQAARPGRPSVLGAVNDTFVRHAQAKHSGAYVSGVGGDSVFCLLNSAAPVVDRIRSHRDPRGWLETLIDVAAINDTTLWAAGRQAWRIVGRADPRPPDKPDMTFLALRAAPQPQLHAWLAAAPPDALPGRYRHLASIAYIQGYMDGQTRSRDRPMIAPLMAQPVIELALRVPTWLWVAGGRDRAVARAAFDSDLPASVAHRRSKGRIDRLVREVYERQRSDLRHLLIGGRLQAQGLLDAAGVEAVLRRPVDPLKRDYRRLLEIADVETWARSWDP